MDLDKPSNNYYNTLSRPRSCFWSSIIVHLTGIFQCCFDVGIYIFYLRKSHSLDAHSLNETIQNSILIFFSPKIKLFSFITFSRQYHSMAVKWLGRSHFFVKCRSNNWMYCTCTWRKWRKNIVWELERAVN